ncbi:MAG: hypothetical protein JO277_13045 [Candidatus Eremiobacteraeota bacterium]|nr:hypothetical protein [Candidatus Eremiobacteraeota bacterium]
MPTPDELTVSFATWPIMILLEGPATSIGTLIGMMYADQNVPRDSWTVEHAERSRKAYAERLKRAGSGIRRQGVGIRVEATAKVLEARARALGITTTRFSSTTASASTTR